MSPTALPAEHDLVEAAEAALARGGLLRAPQVCALVGITHRQLDYWARTDLVRPSRAARGSGTHRGYDAADVALLRFVRATLDAGVSLQRIRAALPLVREASGGGALAGAR